MGSPHKVLIIDDDPLILLTLKAYLEDSGYMVFQAADGEEGVELFVRSEPDIVLTDLRMPKLDGLGVIAAVKAQHPETPVIVFTGTGEHFVTNDVVRLGAWCCLYKPLGDLNNLVAAIEMALAQNKEG
jgi:sigma-B regulation protein RsbU (phosphoserine phosphatase)